MLRSRRARLVTLLALGVAACSGGGGADSKAPTVTAPSAPVLTTVTVSLAASTVQVGQTTSASAAGLDQNGAAIAIGAVTWSSGSPSIATVSTTGVVSGMAAGQVSITATVSGRTGQASLTVIPVPVATVSVTPAAVSLVIGATQQLAAATLDGSGNALAGRVVTWSTSDSTKARVSTTGLVTAIAAGSSTVTATSEAKSGTSVVTVSPPPATAQMAAGSEPWFHNYLKNTDGSETLVLTTQGKWDQFTPPTPIVILKPTGNGVADITSQLFDAAPSLYFGRNVVTYKDPITSQQAIWFCSHGREVGDVQAASTPRVNGIWGEQDKLFVMGANGKFSDQSSKLPQVVDFTHGCAAGNNGDGNSVVLVKNTSGRFGGYEEHQVLAKGPSGTYVPTSFSPNSIPDWDWRLKSWWVGVGDFSKRGAVDMVYSQRVVRYQTGSYRVTQTMRAPDLEAQGYKNYHGGVVADVNGDGHTDVIQILSGDGVSKTWLGGAMLALFINDGTGNLIYTPGAIPSPQTPSDISLDVRLFDVNFDGKADIVSSGGRYGVGSPYTPTTEFLYINNGNGTFTKKTVVDAEMNSRCLAISANPRLACQLGYYFMANSDGSSYSIVMTGHNYLTDVHTAYGRTVTPATPLGLR